MASGVPLQMPPWWPLLLFLLAFHSLVAVVGVTDPGDYEILVELRNGLENPELLKWPEDDDDPCGNKWPHVFCSGVRVTQIQVANLGLSGPLPSTFNRLSMLYNLGLQRNQFTGPLPTFRGLSGLEYAYLGWNAFTLIPHDFFDGLSSLKVISLEHNPLNSTSGGWSLPSSLETNSPQLVNFSCDACNLVGPIPPSFGAAAFPSLANLRLAYNALTGPLPPALAGSNLQTLVINNQEGDGLTGSISILPKMPSLVTVWLHGNSFSGTIPANITSCISLQQLVLNNNRLTGLVPRGLQNLTALKYVNLNNNMFLGPIPDLDIETYNYSGNSFCRGEPGADCAPEVTALLGFLAGVGYPLDLAESWAGNDPCASWLGVSCASGEVSVINLPNRGLTGFISPFLCDLGSLTVVRLNGNNLSGTIPTRLATLSSLRMLNLSSNNLSPPVPEFPGSVTLLVDENPYIQNAGLHPPPPSPPSRGSPSWSSNGSSPTSPSGGGGTPTPPHGSPPGSNVNSSGNSSSNGAKVAIIAGVSAASAVLLALLIALSVCLCKKGKKKDRTVSPGSVVVHPGDSPNSDDNAVKVSVADNAGKGAGSNDPLSMGSVGGADAPLFHSGSLVVSVQVLRDATRDFDPENVVGRGGFGVVYKGVLHDGTTIAVKRMESTILSSKALDEFQSEIAVLSKVRHRNLVSMLGFSVEGSERLLVYEYMSQGALSRHLFHWKKLGIEPLSWKKRLNVALDVARGMEYLHGLAHQSFIHRDLKSSNILLDDGYRAKVADFGLVKLAPDGKNSVATRLAGTFGYLAPEYAVTGKITTKADVFSFGVVLMELLTGMSALDEDRPEETRYLASWFYDIKSCTEKLRAAIDPTIDLTDENFESIWVLAELAGHCAAREPQQRPDMGHAVSVLAPLIEKWRPTKDDQEEYLGIDLHQPLLQMVKGWQADDCSDMSSLSLDDSKGSIPPRPTGFADSFTSSDGR